MKILLALALSMPGLVFAAGQIDGTWKIDLATMKTVGKPTVYRLKDGIFSCPNCTPPYSIKADGSDRPVKGRDYADTIAVSLIDANNLTFAGKLAGKPTFSSAMALSPDGNTLTSTFKESLGTEPVTGVQTAKRKGKPFKGESAFSGKWDFTPTPTLSEASITVTYASSPDGLQMKWNGQQYDARFDGKKVPMSNDVGQTLVTVKKISDHEFIETDYRNGKIVEVTHSKVGADGKTMVVSDEDLVRDKVSTYIMNKQP